MRTALDAVGRVGWRRRSLLGLGTVSLLTGLALIAIGVSSLMSGEPDRSVGRVVDLGTDEGFAYAFRTTATPSPIPNLSPSPTTDPTPTQQPAPPLKDALYRMIIDKIGVDAPVLTFGLDENAIPEIPTDPWDVAWYDFSAQPGTGSNAVFAGHVTWFGPGVFYDLYNWSPAIL